MSVEPISLSTLVALAVITLVSLAAHVAQSRHMSTLAGALNHIVDDIAGNTPLTGHLTAASGGGHVPQRADVLPWLPTSVLPVYGQLTQTLPTGAETETWYNDCGEVCVSMVVRAARGVYVPGDVLRVLLRGQGGSALTNEGDLVTMLSLCTVSAHAATWGPGTAIQAMRDATEDGRPVIALGRWPTPGGVLHWLVVTSVNTTKIYYINPWSREHSYLGIADWQQYSANSYVEVDSHLLRT